MKHRCNRIHCYHQAIETEVAGFRKTTMYPLHTFFYFVIQASQTTDRPVAEVITFHRAKSVLVVNSYDDFGCPKSKLQGCPNSQTSQSHYKDIVKMCCNMKCLLQQKGV
jgi:hypothetical protein